ncbi:hypothetical protein BDW02DRAFT_501361 [Decorospora gaudefroyi]|uniref:Uncharacterized protein n=1 Tax=Decorospora gaudefroyi TaxID=184978 RepID=A0A6A5K961_9PLEO|nr:hypothetical protein BDW02DRAFT_501361 [Decorospora gaudefroyi]
MTFFNGPWTEDLDSFKKSVQSMPDQYKSSFASASESTLKKICDPNVLHIWESDSDIDSLLQLTSIIAKLCDLGVRKSQGANAEDGSMLIIAEESKSRNNFSRICQLVEHLTGADGKKHLEGTVVVFSKIIVVRGWDNSILSGQKEALEKTVKRLNTAIERVLKMGNFQGENKKIVWHHGAVIQFLLYWINTTTSSLRSALSAITITGSLDLTSGVAPSTAGRANKLPDLERLKQYGKKLSIPVVFLDSASQLITYEYLGTYMYFYAYYINTFLPTSLSRAHLNKAQDELITFAFRLRGASEGRYGTEVIKLVQKHLDASKAKHWARMCVDKASYTKPSCLAAGKDASIHHAVQLADAPFARLAHSSSGGVPAFARLAVGPASASAHEYYTAAPVAISFGAAKLRPSSPATLYILIPTPSQDLEKVTNRVQGLMMAVLERVRQEKGNPVLADSEKSMWKAVVKACTWAMQGKMPTPIADKVKFVSQKLREGTWGFALGAPVGGDAVMKTDTTATAAAAAAAAMPEPLRTYGFGLGTQQTAGSFPYHPDAQNQAMPPAGPMPSPVMGAAYAQQLPGQQGLVYPQGQGQGHVYAGQGGAGAYGQKPVNSGGRVVAGEGGHAWKLVH